MELSEFLKSDEAEISDGIWISTKDPTIFAPGDADGNISVGYRLQVIKYEECIWFGCEAYLPAPIALVDEFGSLLAWYGAIDIDDKETPWPSLVAIQLEGENQPRIVNPTFLLSEYYAWKLGKKDIKTSIKLLESVDAEIKVMRQESRNDAIETFLDTILPGYVDISRN